MIRFRSVLLPLFLLAVTVLSAGCSGEAADPLSGNDTAADDYAAMDFSQPCGGLTATDEDVAFGDESLQMMMLAEDEELVDDPVAAAPRGGWAETPIRSRATRAASSPDVGAPSVTGRWWAKLNNH